VIRSFSASFSTLMLGFALGALAFSVGAAEPKAGARSTAAAKAKPAAKPAAKAVAKSAPRTVAKNTRTVKRAAPPPERFNPDVLELQSTSALVVNLQSGDVVYNKNTSAVVPIASITKLMTAMVVLDARLPLDEPIALTEEDLDYLKNTGSRLQVGTVLTRDEMLRLALMSSENRAAAALGRAYPGGAAAFVREMNLKAMALDMMQTSFADSTGLSSGNVSTAQDLAKMVTAAYQYPLIRQYSTGNGYAVQTVSGRMLEFRNTNALIPSADWQIELSKTGYIREAGRCLVMQAVIAGSPVVIVLLDSWGRLSRAGDANRVKKWMEYHAGRMTVG
jgi:serine-type D-Ala-D-Ala endopeptidase (penicillin-binding protein 7)